MTGNRTGASGLAASAGKGDYPVKTSTLNYLKTGAAPFVLGLAIMAGPALAQDVPATAPAADAPDDQVIIVTGSRIARPGLVSTSPVATITGDSFQTFNSPTAEKLLSQNPQFLPSNTPAVNNGNPGAATIDIRGLGENRTLVLVDGKRMMSYDYDGVVDINAIPVALIKRVTAKF